MKANLKKILGLATLGMTLTVGTVQAASLLASDPVYGGPQQNHVACQIFNAGNTPITFLNRGISSQNSVAVPLTFNNCVGVLRPNSICTFQAAADNQAFACKALIAEGKANVRGTIAALTSTNVLVSEAPIR